MILKRTKIVATMGPACSSVEMLSALAEAGMNVCRLNFSHGSHEDHKIVIENIREVNRNLGIDLAILADLQGPKLRIGEVENNGVLLEDGGRLTITTTKMVGTSEKVYITYPQFPKDTRKGERILLDDGKIELEVLETNESDEVVTKVIHGGILSSKKGVNLPNTKVSLPSLTPKDYIDLDFALDNNVDWVALSFVRSARDIIEVKHYINDKKKQALVIAKIEKPEAIEDIDDIIEETDALMVARGDLGVEIPLQNVPLIQKMLIKKCIRKAKPVIVATQMMESMIYNATPTRAEVNDVANAVLDGADAVMLSAETSVGKFPLEVIKTMTKIVLEMETFDGIYHQETIPDPKQKHRFITDSICLNACRLSARVSAVAIITMTHSGYTAFKISSQRPKANIYVFTSNREMLCRLNLVWGVKCIFYDKTVSTDHTIADIKYILRKDKLIKEGDLIINTASMPITEMGMTNMVKLSYA